MSTQTNHERVLSELERVFSENADKRIYVLGATCVGKNYLLRDLPHCVDLDQIIMNSLPQDIQKRLVDLDGLGDEAGLEAVKIWNENKQLSKVKINRGQPVFGAEAFLDCDLLVYLNIDETTHKKRATKRGFSLEFVLQHKQYLEKKLAQVEVPVITIDVSSPAKDYGPPK